jgi:hypothetical protein
MTTEDSEPEGTAPSDNKPDAYLPEDAARNDSVPETDIPEDAAPNDSVPDTDVPDHGVATATLPVPPLALTTLGRLISYGLLCGFIGFLMSLRALADATLPHILTQDGYNFQGVLDGLPIPRLLDWNPTLIGLLQQYTTLNPVLSTLGALAVLGFLWICTLRVLFPTLRLFHTVPGTDPADIATVSTVALNSRLLLQMGRLFFLVGLPLAVVSLGVFATPRFPKLAVVLSLTQFVAAGIWLRVALRPGNFVARTLSSFGRMAHRKQGAGLLPEIGIGVLFGLPAYLLQASAMRLPSEDVLRSLHALGTFHVVRWNDLALHYLLSVSLISFGIGLLFLLLFPLRMRSFSRLLALALVLLCVPLSLWLKRPYSAQSLAIRWDITPPIMLTAWPYTPTQPGSGVPDGVEPARALARLSGIVEKKLYSSQDHQFLLFTKGAVLSALQHGYTEDGLNADPASIPKVREFLRQRDYNTALSWTAFKHIYNIGNIHFDSTLALRACLDDLERYPHAAVVTRSMSDALFTMAASPQNLALLDEWADPTRFDHADRPCLKLMGDLYLRFGEQPKALEWYRRADMPRSFMAQVRANKPLFHAGQIQGTVLWNGKPLVGVDVGAFPYLQNGLPKELEGQVRAAERGLIPPFAYSEKFGPAEPRPYQFRWMSAGTTTDSAGHFTLSHLTEGTYHLVCKLPADVVLAPVHDERLRIVNAPTDITLRYARPNSDLGTITLTFHP